MDEILDDFESSGSSDSENWEFIAFVGKNSEYYLDKWNDLKNGNTISFNWASFLFGIGWLLYRKMYLETIILVLFISVETELTYYFFGENSFLELGIQLCYALFTGFMGNYFYLKFAQRKILSARRSSTTEFELKESLIRIGGTSWPSAIIGILLAGAIFVLVEYLISFLY